ncbi:unnamed protein product [Mytilus coruscus]|uniref:Integrase catalytic domain-containing protein n=1 Tax=Mytilus coruscus TaxID=42192 RepID=A0A6J8DFV5_MYTCO|nr:unnamed protein product [Mytilus coruscus]
MHTDRGTQFESKLFQDLCFRLNIDKTRPTAMHPQRDGIVERLNKTLEDILSKYITKHQKDWDKHLHLALMAYRSSPSILMFGRETELPVDLIYGSYPDSVETEDLRKGLWNIHEVAREKMKHASNRQKRQYDTKVHSRQYRVGDAVWIFNPLRRKGLSPKLQPHWIGPYIIKIVYTDLIYKIARQYGLKEIVIHHDRLKPYFGSLDTVPESSSDVIGTGGPELVSSRPSRLRKKRTYLKDFV